MKKHSFNFPDGISKCDQHIFQLDWCFSVPLAVVTSKTCMGFRKTTFQKDG
jgi:hypothetical protein